MSADEKSAAVRDHHVAASPPSHDAGADLVTTAEAQNLRRGLAERHLGKRREVLRQHDSRLRAAADALEPHPVPDKPGGLGERQRVPQPQPRQVGQKGRLAARPPAHEQRKTFPRRGACGGSGPLREDRARRGGVRGVGDAGDPEPGPAEGGFGLLERRAAGAAEPEPLWIFLAAACASPHSS